MSATLVEFLRARFDEDEQVARGASPSPWRDPDEATELESLLFTREDAYHIYRWEPARVLAGVKAKRRILERHQSHSMGNCRVCEVPHWGVLVCNHCFGKAWPCLDLLDLAAVYAGHPEYLPEWAPDE